MKTGMKAWVAQRSKDIAQRGKKHAPWVVFWNDPSGKRKEKSCGPGRDGRLLAMKEKQRIHSALVSGSYGDIRGGTWAEFRAEYETTVADGMDPSTKRCTLTAINHFERIVKPSQLRRVKSQTVAAYVADRRKEPGKKKGDNVSPATINKELRHLKAVFAIAHEWGHLPEVPKVRMVKEPEKLPLYITPEHFATIYEACSVANKPKGLPYKPEDWWRSLLTFQYMTGWRVGEPTALLRRDLDLEAGDAITRHGDNKGKRDERVPLHPVVVEHLLGIQSFHSLVFPWPHHERTLWTEFARIQQAAGIHLPCAEDHEHTDACHLYGFHDLRRAFATQNANQLTAPALQSLMRHRSLQTTMKHINMAKQLDGAVQALHVPPVLRRTAGGN